MSHEERTRLRVTLPATSANLGPGFDAAGLALSMRLSVDARTATKFELTATGRDAAICGNVESNLILDTYQALLRRAGREPVPLHLTIDNQIPLGMGCGSSAAALLAGTVLADYFGYLGMTANEIVAEASRFEGHPDNVAACWFGGFTVAAERGEAVETATFPGSPEWEMILVLPENGSATSEARAILPERYLRGDAVFNIQGAALLVAAFAQKRIDLLRAAMQDRMHQPYRAAAFLEMFAPLFDLPEVAGVTLSGAGPAALVFLSPGATEKIKRRLRLMLPESIELRELGIGAGVTVTPL